MVAPNVRNLDRDVPGEALIVSTRPGPETARVKRLLGANLSRIPGNPKKKKDRRVTGLKMDQFAADPSADRWAKVPLALLARNPSAGRWAEVPFVRDCDGVAWIVNGDDTPRPHPEERTAPSQRTRAERSFLATQIESRAREFQLPAAKKPRTGPCRRQKKRRRGEKNTPAKHSERERHAPRGSEGSGGPAWSFAPALCGPA